MPKKKEGLYMNEDIIQTEIFVEENKVSIMRVNNLEYISLTDLARYANSDEPKIPIQAWMRNKDVIAYLGLWEKLNNENFKGLEFTTFEKEAGKNSFYMSPQKWIKETNAKGIISKSGNNGGTFAHSDIAFEFASWLSPEFKLYLIQEFERLKKNESYQYQIEWKANRVLTKVNYLLQTDAIKINIIPVLTEEQKRYIYAEEADVLNVALFGMTAKQWRIKHPELAKMGNIRDYTDLLHLVILNNLENTNAELINIGLSQSERLVKLNNSARRQMETLKWHKGIRELENLQNEIINTEILKIREENIE